MTKYFIIFVVLSTILFLVYLYVCIKVFIRIDAFTNLAMPFN